MFYPLSRSQSTHIWTDWVFRCSFCANGRTVKDEHLNLWQDNYLMTSRWKPSIIISLAGRRVLLLCFNSVRDENTKWSGFPGDIPFFAYLQRHHLHTTLFFSPNMHFHQDWEETVKIEKVWRYVSLSSCKIIVITALAATVQLPIITATTFPLKTNVLFCQRLSAHSVMRLKVNMGVYAHAQIK